MINVQTKTGLLISKGFVRVHKKYIEIESDQIQSENLILIKTTPKCIEYHTTDRQRVSVQQCKEENDGFQQNYYYVKTKDVRIVLSGESMKEPESVQAGKVK